MLTEPVLSIDAYEQAERRGTGTLSIPHMMAFRPVSFESVGWPTRVTAEHELLRYVDHNFEAETASLFKPRAVFPPAGYRNAFTRDEQELVGRVRDRVAELTQAWFGRRVRPVTNILVQVGPYRLMRALANTHPQLSVFEVGPGVGYLGAMLAATGHRYMSFDVTQSLYLWQSRLMQGVSGAEFNELALSESPEEEQAGLAAARVVHLPWWSYVRMLQSTSVRADVVYSNSNLSEMSRVALRHVLHISRQMLADSPFGLFCFFSKGSPAQSTHEAIDQELRAFGYHKAFDKPFHAFTLRPDQGKMLAKMFKDGLPFYNPSGGPTSLTADDVVPLRREESPLDVALSQWYHGWQPPFVN
jgi:hypothetical protein